MALTLYGHPFSSYTWKVLIALYANGTEFALHTVGNDPSDRSFLDASHPAGKFPVLLDGAATIIEATAIVEYLAVHHSGDARLIPSNPAEAVVLRMLDRVFDNYVMGNMQQVVAAYLQNRDNPDPVDIEAGRQGLQRVYRWLEDWLGSNAVPPHVSLFTCAAAPSLFYADWVESIPDEYSRLNALRAELLAVPAVIRCVDEARPYREYFPPGAPDRD